jgi:hypothetical protein
MSWQPKWQHDIATDGWSPIPTQIVSNEEYLPLPPTPEQRQVAHRLRETSRLHAATLGVSRREFLATPCGMAAAFLAMNAVFGRFFDVDPVEAWETAAVSARQPQGQFVFDIQTHHVGAGRQLSTFFRMRETARLWNRDIGPSIRMEDAYLANYVKEVFLDSDTSVAVISGVPFVSDKLNFLPVDQMVETREVINRLVASRRLVAHGLIAPTRGKKDLEEMERQATQLKVEAWKGYTGALAGSAWPQTWDADDEKVSYPMLQTARRLGVKNICLHKGLPFPSTKPEDWHPRDIAKAARDFPDLNFIVYHSGLKDVREAMRVDLSRPPARINWVTDLCEIRQKNPTLTNVYAELGSTFGLTAITAPNLCAHILGMLVQHLGADHVLWGTDSIWWGTPQWQIDAFRRLTMPESLMQTFGYAPLTPDVKAQILGLNAAAVYGVDPAAMLNPMPTDFVSKLKAAYRDDRPQPSLTQYGWVLGSSR